MLAASKAVSMVVSIDDTTFRVKIEGNCARYKLPSAPPLYEL